MYISRSNGSGRLVVICLGLEHHRDQNYILIKLVTLIVEINICCDEGTKHDERSLGDLLMCTSYEKIMIRSDGRRSMILRYPEIPTTYNRESQCIQPGKVANIPSPATGCQCMNASLTSVDDSDQLLVNLRHLGSWIFATNGKVSTNNHPLVCIIKASLQLNSIHSTALCYDKRSVERKDGSERDIKRSFPFITVLERIFFSMQFDLAPPLLFHP